MKPPVTIKRSGMNRILKNQWVDSNHFKVRIIVITNSTSLPAGLKYEHHCSSKCLFGNIYLEK